MNCQEFHLSHSDEIDFSAAAHFTRLFADLLLKTRLPADVNVLKVDVPASATAATGWRITRLSLQPYFLPVKPQRDDLSTKGKVDYDRVIGVDLEPDSDVAVLINQKQVSVTPLSLDLTSRIDLKAWERDLKGLVNG